MVSVVIPVYKTEKYLDFCLESVVGQTYRDLEILLIDDCSPDGCPRLCDEWAGRDDRIRVIHKQNRGLGMARNTGLEIAGGDYICFLDSDDFLAPEAIARALDLARREQAELVLYGFVSVSETGKERCRRAPKGAVYRGREVRETLLPKLLAGEDGLQMSACWALFSMALVRRANWRFPSEREVLSEDVYALLELLRYADSAAVLEEALYFYRENAASLTRTYRADRFAKTKEFYEKCLELCRKWDYSAEVVRSCGELFLSFAIAAMKQERDAGRLREIVDDGLLQQLLRETEKAGFKRRVLFRTIQKKRYTLCRLLLAAQNRKDGRP